MRTFLVILIFLMVGCTSKNKRSDAYGNFEAKEIIVSSEAQGKILKFGIEEGQALKSGENIGFIDSTQLYLNKEQLVAQKMTILAKIDNVNSQIAIYDEQKKTLLKEKARIESMLKDDAVAAKKLDDIEGQLNVVESQIKSVQIQSNSVSKELQVLSKQIDQVNNQLAKCLIVNSVDGTVLEKYAEEDELATMGKPLYKIADLSSLDLRVYINGSQLPDIRLGQKVKVFVDKDENSNKSYEGIISWISQQAEFTPKIIQTKEERVNLVYAVKVKVINDGTLKIGMPGEVDFNDR